MIKMCVPAVVVWCGAGKRANSAANDIRPKTYENESHVEHAALRGVRRHRRCIACGAACVAVNATL